MEIVKPSLYTLHFLFVRRRRPIILHSLHFLRYEDKTTGWASGLGRSDSVQTRMQYMPPAHSFFGPHLALWSSGERHDVGCIYSYQLRPNIDNDDLCTCLPLSSIVRAAQNTGNNHEFCAAPHRNPHCSTHPSTCHSPRSTFHRDNNRQYEAYNILSWPAGSRFNFNVQDVDRALDNGNVPLRAPSSPLLYIAARLHTPHPFKSSDPNHESHCSRSVLLSIMQAPRSAQQHAPGCFQPLLLAHVH